MKGSEPLVFFAARTATIWPVLHVLLGVLHDWRPYRPIKPPDDEAGRFDPEAGAGDTPQQAAFLASLVAEIADMHRRIKQSEIDTEDLRNRLNSALAKALVLRASLEILEKRIAILRDQRAQQDPLFPPATNAKSPP